MEVTHLSDEGQVMIPEALQAIHQWQAGQELVAIQVGDGILLKSKKPVPETTLDQVAGCLKYEGKPKTLEGATGFAKTLKQEERLIGGILISIPVVLTILIFAIPNDQRFTLVCLTLGSVIVVAILFSLLIQYKRTRRKHLLKTNQDLLNSKEKLEKQLEKSRNTLSNSTRDLRAFLFKLKNQVNQVVEQVEALLEDEKIASERTRDIQRQLNDLAQHIQDEYAALLKAQGSIADAEDLFNVKPDLERELMKRHEQRHESS